MADNGTTATNAQQTSHCTGDCRKCMPIQRAYCSSQIAYSNMKLLDALTQSVAALDNSVKMIQAKVEAIQGNEALLFAPSNADRLSPQQTQEQEGPACTDAIGAETPSAE